MDNEELRGQRILVVEDEIDIREPLLYQLRKEGYAVEGVASAEEALTSVKAAAPDLIILDLMLPGMDGRAFCRLLRRNRNFAALPILMLTARGSEADAINGLDVGADDYVAKPFHMQLLLARIRTLLRRTSATTSEEEEAESKPKATLERGAIKMDRERHEVQANGVSVSLTAAEFRLLWHLLRRPGIVYSRSQLLDAVHGETHAITERAIDVQVVGLRRKLGAAGERIETVRGVGYRYADG